LPRCIDSAQFIVEERIATIVGLQIEKCFCWTLPMNIQEIFATLYDQTKRLDEATTVLTDVTDQPKRGRIPKKPSSPPSERQRLNAAARKRIANSSQKGSIGIRFVIADCTTINNKFLIRNVDFDLTLAFAERPGERGELASLVERQIEIAERLTTLGDEERKNSIYKFEMLAETR
jgi:hypothetical protein